MNSESLSNTDRQAVFVPTNFRFVDLHQERAKTQPATPDVYVELLLPHCRYAVADPSDVPA